MDNRSHAYIAGWRAGVAGKDWTAWPWLLESERGDVAEAWARGY